MEIFLENSMKRTISEHALTVNMWKRLKCLQNHNERPFFMFFIILREFDLENVSPSIMLNLRVVY